MQTLILAVLMIGVAYGQAKLNGSTTAASGSTQDNSTATVTRPVVSAASDPATCTAGKDMYINTASTPVVKLCTATNTWTAVGGASVTKAPWTIPFIITSNLASQGSAFSCSGGAETPPGCGNLNNDFSVTPSIQTIHWAAAADHAGYAETVLPFNWDGGVLKLDIFESPAANGGTITFNAQVRCLPNTSANTFVSYATGTGFGTAAGVTTTITNQNTWDHSITLNTVGCAAGNPIQIVIIRKGSTDSNTGDARMWQLTLSGFTTLQ